MLGVKHKSIGDAAGSAKKRQAITMKTKVDIIKRVDRGEKMADVAWSYQMNRSTIGTILKNKDKIMEREKFSAYCNSLHNVKVAGEAASADTVAAQEFPTTLREIIEEGEFLPQQIFNMPQQTYISKEKKSMLGFKAAKDRPTLLLGANTEGDMKLKALLVYHSENPRALKNIAKASLPVVWNTNPKAWVTLALYQDWFYHHFIPEVERYCQDKNIPFHILLLLDNAPGHPPFLDDFHPNVKVVFMPPNTTSLLQPMDQGVIGTFKKYYLHHTFHQALKATEGESGMSLCNFWKSFTIYDAIKNIDASWRELTNSTMNGVWKKLCAMFVHDFAGFGKIQADKHNVVKNLVRISEKLDLALQEDDFHEYLEVHHQELTNEDLMELMELENQKKEEEKEEKEVRFCTFVYNKFLDFNCMLSKGYLHQKMILFFISAVFYIHLLLISNKRVGF
uniref:DDE-1 domain-containing protein n=1 Tax=Kryptolebias marmoratus TaxID=37003 RepID=A0A3Q3GU97_KRYMA